MTNYDEIFKIVKNFNSDYENEVRKKSNRIFNEAELLRLIVRRSKDDIVYFVNCRRKRSSGDFDNFSVVVEGKYLDNVHIQDSSWLILNEGKYKVVDVVEL